ncbi:hypothetical protein E4H04_06870 [Candidatus Bathyarchaeota archaeon]|nr:MAG: hypothetical protein E4H04_06870 [Candidatus Bathyarchaeota archaeon]
MFTRTDEDGDFSAPMGLAITIRDRDRFRTLYDEIMLRLMEKNGHVCKKPVYKAASLTSQLLHLTNEFLKDFLKLISSEIQRIDVFYTFYPNGSVDDIITCGDSYPRKVPPEKFLRQIEKGYEHYCVWNYCDEYSLATDNLFEVDHFTAKITPAWDQIKDLPNFSIFFSGGECNKAISLADLILRFIVNNCKGRLNHQNISGCLREYTKDVNIRTHWMGHYRKYLNNMAYRDDFDIDLKNNIQHPIFWIEWDR